jgi:lipopolysaccharide/colanic/teichoic acid biosynthesis glycosyltransferase
MEQPLVRLADDSVEGVPAENVAPAPSRLYPIAKRALDLAVATAMLVVAVPIFVIAAVAIKLDSPGPVLLRQERIGERGRRFAMLKFRSMYVQTDDRLHREAFQRYRNGEAIGEDRAAGAVYKLSSDPRVTRVGQILRTFSLDELPQLLNVLKGEMSLVGPRPALPYEVALYDSAHLRRLDVPQGMTGLWQVYGRGRVSFDGYMALDLEYVVRRTFVLDLKLLALTLPAVLSRRGAR